MAHKVAKRGRIQYIAAAGLQPPSEISINRQQTLQGKGRASGRNQVGLQSGSHAFHIHGDTTRHDTTRRQHGFLTYLEHIHAMRCRPLSDRRTCLHLLTSTQEPLKLCESPQNEHLQYSGHRLLSRSPCATWSVPRSLLYIEKHAPTDFKLRRLRDT